jgi:hypothetical protein
MNIQNNIRTSSSLLVSRKRQQGVIMVVYAIGMLMILALAGLALDVPHAMLNKARLQNTVDAAALSAAEILDNTTDTVQATAMAQTIFALNAEGAGNGEMKSGVAAGDIVVEYSESLEPFTNGSGTPTYVRVRVETFSLQPWLIQLLGFTEKNVRASAVAGPSPTLGAACDLVPLLICGDPAAPAPFFGYQDDEVTVLKSGPDTNADESDIGPGNFQLARLGGSGLDVVRTNLAGGYEGCQVLGDTVPTQTGGGTGPVAQGINSRLGIFHGKIKPGDFPPDVVTTVQVPPLTLEDDGSITQNNVTITDSSMIDFNYDDYTDRVDNGPLDNLPPAGTYERRNLSVMIVDCTGLNNGQTDIPILGFACYFLLQEMEAGAGGGGGGGGPPEFEMFGEFVAECDAKGTAGPNPTTAPGPYRIQLYKDVDSRDS